MTCDNTPTARQPNYQIATSNDNAANLRIFEEIAAASGRPLYFQTPRAMGNYDHGAFELRGNGTRITSGFALVTWLIGVVSREQHYYLRTTYCGGGYSGLVTVRTTVGDASTFANYNAVLLLPKDIDGDYRIKQFVDYPMVFTRLVAL